MYTSMQDVLGALGGRDNYEARVSATRAASDHWNSAVAGSACVSVIIHRNKGLYE